MDARRDVDGALPSHAAWLWQLAELGPGTRADMSFANRVPPFLANNCADRTLL